MTTPFKRITTRSSSRISKDNVNNNTHNANNRLPQTPLKNQRKRKASSLKNDSSDNNNIHTNVHNNIHNNVQNITNNVWDEYKFTQSENQDLLSRIREYSTESPNNNMLCWVSATKTKNYLLGDHCVDWLNMYYDKFGLTSAQLSESDQKIAKSFIKDASHLNILLEGGNTFEKKVYDELKDIYKNDFVIVFDESDMKTYREEHQTDGGLNFIRNGCERVRELMLKGVPIIAQAPLINDNNHTFGIADILIRSDYLSTFFKLFEPDNNIHVQAPLLSKSTSTSTSTSKSKKSRLNNGYHYRVIDCKWTTMVLCVDGVTLRNEGYFPAYKGQLAVYTACLEQLQGYIPTVAYIMAKAWKIDKANVLKDQETQYRGYSAFDRPGVIDYTGRDAIYLEKTKNAVMWVQKIMTDGSNWRYHQDAPSVFEMYPNMTKTFNPMYDKIKSTIAHRYKDPTLVWYVGADHRKNAHAKGVTSLDDDRCTASLMGINNARSRIIDAIIDINRSSQVNDLIRPLCIQNHMGDWQNAKTLDYYVDFETINYNLYAHPEDMDINNSYNGSEVTFMIGFGFDHNPHIDTHALLESLNDNNNTQYKFIHNHDITTGWEFVCIYLVQFKVQHEMEIFRFFFDFILARSEIHKLVHNLTTAEEISRLFHWTGAEIRFINKAITRILSDENTQLSNLIKTFQQHSMWVDMYKVFESEPIVVKGSYRFKLKHVGNAFHSHGLIDTKWDDGKMSDGFKAMLEAIKLYRANPLITHEHDMYKEIIDYNEIDCRVMWEIVNYLRDNHCVPLLDE